MSGPFKMKGWSPFTKVSPAKDTSTKEHAESQKHNADGEHVNKWGETPEEYKKRMEEMGLREPGLDTEKESPAKIYDKPKGKRTEYIK